MIIQDIERDIACFLGYTCGSGGGGAKGVNAVPSADTRQTSNTVQSETSLQQRALYRQDLAR